MKKQNKGLIVVATLLMLLGVGALIGSYVQKSQVQSANNALYETTKIAVVNLDEGIEENEKSKSYSLDLLNANDDTYTITHLENAKNGINSGEYGGYIVIPQDFSSKVHKINSDPVQPVLNYEVSGKLTPKASDFTTINIFKIKDKLNDNLSYAYLYSIVDNVHNAQDASVKVLANAQDAQKLVGSISNVNLLTAMEITDVAPLEKNVGELNINSEEQAFANNASNLDETYKSSMANVNSGLEALKNQTTTNFSGFGGVENKIDGLSYLSDLDTNQLLVAPENTYEQLEQYRTTLKQQLDDIVNNVNGGQLTVDQQKTDMVKAGDTQIQDIKNYNKDLTKKVLEQNSAITNNGKQVEAMIQRMQDQYKNLTEKMGSDYFKGQQNAFNSYVNNANNEIKKLVDNHNMSKATTTKIRAMRTLDTYIIDKTAEVAKANPSLTKEEIINEISNNATTTINNTLATYLRSNGTDTFTNGEISLVGYVRDLNRTSATDADRTNLAKINLNDYDITKNYRDITIGQDYTKYLDKYAGQINAGEIKAMKNLDLTTVNIAKFEQTFESFKAATLGNQKEILNSVNQVAYIDLEKIRKNITDDFLPFGSKQYADVADIKSALTALKDNTSGFNADFINYDALGYLDKATVEKIMANINANYEQMYGKIYAQDKVYQDFLNESYAYAQNHIRVIRDDVSKYQKASDEKIAAGLATAQQTIGTQVEENADLLGSFATQLGYTRRGTVKNTDSYEFIVNPSKIDGKRQTVEMSKKTDWLNIASIGAVAVGGTLMLAALFKNRKKKQSNIDTSDDI